MTWGGAGLWAFAFMKRWHWGGEKWEEPSCEENHHVQLAEVGLNNPCECEQLCGDRCGRLGWASRGSQQQRRLATRGPRGAEMTGS